MTSKTYFDNQYDNYSPEKTFKCLNDNQVSAEYKQMLSNFKTEKINILNTTLQNDVFYDNTVYTGSVGLSLYYFNCAANNNFNKNLLQLALNYLDLKKLKNRRITFLCGDAGSLALATVISLKLGSQNTESSDYKNYAKRLMALNSLLNESPDELLYGKAGYLYALLFVNKHAQQTVIPPQHIQEVIEAIIRSGKKFSDKMKSESPLLWQWHDKIYLGGAHGIAGILYILLQAQEYISVNVIENYIKPTLDWLLSQRFKSGNFMSSVGSTSGDRLVQWCHGAPGFVPLLLLAYQMFQDDKYLKIAIECGEVVWQRGLCKKGYSICHGVAGNAYTFIQLYQATKEPIHLYRACCFMEWCASEKHGSELHHPDRPASLFEGLVGRLYLAEDILHIGNAKFPAYTL